MERFGRAGKGASKGTLTHFQIELSDWTGVKIIQGKSGII